jgi:NAD(P)H-hydrate repair Nnr-like enzyme with NAD(P)H-hydrate epimerase domain
MKVVTAKEMRHIDAKTVQEFGISRLVLMERAGLAVSRRIKELFGQALHRLLENGFYRLY